MQVMLKDGRAFSDPFLMIGFYATPVLYSGQHGAESVLPAT